jgi:hypothetical protein
MDRRITKRSAPWLVLLAPRPGEQGYICEGLVPRGVKDRVVLVAVALAYSHAFWLEFCLDQDPALSEVLEHAWTFFGGSPRSWLFETRAPSAPLDRRVLEQARCHGAIARPLVAEDRVCWGEWALRSVPERLLRRSLLRELGLANRALRGFALEMLERPHPQTPDRRVGEVLEQERRCLRQAGRS